MQFPAVSFVPIGTKRCLQDRMYHMNVVHKCAIFKNLNMAQYPRRKNIQEVIKEPGKYAGYAENFSDIESDVN